MRQFKNHSEYLDAKYKYDQYESCVKEYLRNNKTNAIPVAVADTFPFASEVDNDLRSAIEEWEFKIKPPVNYFIYVNVEKRIVTTWTGQTLGRITSVGHVFTSNFGDKRQYITFLGINGFNYGGFYYKSSGDYARVKQLKS